jgi:hypothetical protein
MATPTPTNSTADVFRNAHGPPETPAVSGVPIFIKGDWANGHREGEANPFGWTHIALIAFGADVRDGYAGANQLSGPDSLYVPTSSGTRYQVVFIERVLPGTPQDHLRVYLDRFVPNWSGPPSAPGEI